MSEQKPSKKDLDDAIEHADVYGNRNLSFSDFDLEFLGNLSVDELGQYDDIQAWADLDADDFEDLSTKEKFDLLVSFRGKQWAERAVQWLKTGIPPIVIITAPDGDSGDSLTQIGDGRGRVNFAIAFGLKVPTWHLIYKGLQESTMKTTKKQLEAIIRESVKRALEGLDFGDRDWLQSRQDDDTAVRQNVMKQGSQGSPAFGQLIQAANAAFRKIQARGDAGKTQAALQIKREVEQLAQAPQSGANVMRARMLTGKLVALFK